MSAGSGVGVGVAVWAQYGRGGGESGATKGLKGDAASSGGMLAGVCLSTRACFKAVLDDPLGGRRAFNCGMISRTVRSSMIVSRATQSGSASWGSSVRAARSAVNTARDGVDLRARGRSS